MSGRPTTLTKQLSLKIRKLYLDYQSVMNIQEALEIPDGTWDSWLWNNSQIDGDTQGFRDFYNNCKAERIIRKAEVNLEVLMDSEDERVMADMTKFSLETLGGYSKKTVNENLNKNVEITKEDMQAKNAIIDEAFEQ